MTTSTLPGPLPIKRLHETLINRIAAGEIIHRPSSALKELIENSLDAGSTSIKITIKDGGLKLLQIQDNGCGIRKSDLPILCERFTTSKLTSFSDLSSLTTYGFRGEALASISHVAHLFVVTKTKDDSCAWKAFYVDGALAPPKPGQNSDLKPCAGNDGTLITAEDLFYNSPTRLSSLKSGSDEYSRILDVVTRYATHNPNVSFTCKKASSPSPDVSTPSSSTVSQTIKILYGASIARELIHVTTSSSDSNEKEVSIGDATEVKGNWKAEAYITNSNYHAKKMVFLLFINNRLVESSRIKKSIEGIYGGILPKGMAPFVYLSLEIDPKDVDVNVHPTKREVHFLNEESIVESIANALQEHLTCQSESRVFEYQTLLTGGILQPSSSEQTDNAGGNRRERTGEAAGSSNTQQKIYSHHKIRTSGQDRTLDSMFPVSNQDSQTPGTPRQSLDQPAAKGREVKESECFLTSVVHLRHNISKSKHNFLTEIVKKHIFVGIVDLYRGLSLVQHQTKLYLVNHATLAEELFYQLGLRQFGNFGLLKLEPAPSLETLIRIAVDADPGVEKSGRSKDAITAAIVDILIARREMLETYFSLKISEEGVLESLPMLLRDYTPNLDRLPLFLMRLGPQVEWSSESGCFSTFLRELALLYNPIPLSRPGETERGEEERSERWQIEHVLFPTMRRYLHAPKSLLDQDSIVQVGNLPDLYRVFERC